ncbi:MAG: hypothetical protein EBS01_00520 [Verrucomicrobia bacterium]|nr:hypothetical protein [Verrucomicrobiota bacterium]
MRPTPRTAAAEAKAPVLGREEEARRDLGATHLGKGAGALAVAGFLLLLSAVFIAAQFHKNTVSNDGFFEIVSTLFRPAKTEEAEGWTKWLNWLPSPSSTRAVEKRLEERSPIVELLRPRVQAVLTNVFHTGNEQAVLGRDGWLFFRRDLDYVNGRSFMDPEQQRSRALRDSVQTDPVAAIRDFRDQLAARGIRLVIVPVPVKPCIESRHLSQTAPNAAYPQIRQNTGFGLFLSNLRSEGVEAFDPGELLAQRLSETNKSQYLATDTHWTPEAMEAVAEQLAQSLGASTPQTTDFSSVSTNVAAHGDILALLGLPTNQTLFQKQAVTIHRVSAGNNLWKPSTGADILLLGDSFSNIYSLEPMGWGESAGFGEHLSAALGRTGLWGLEAATPPAGKAAPELLFGARRETDAADGHCFPNFASSPSGDSSLQGTHCRHPPGGHSK